MNPLLKDFVSFCRKHPDMRFWQALVVWSGANKIFFDSNDVYYWEKKKENVDK